MNLAIIASRIHLVWIGAVCGRMKTDFSYSNKMGWHTFPLPNLTQKNRDDLTRCAEDVLRSEEHTSELQSLMRISYAVFCLKKKKKKTNTQKKSTYMTNIMKIHLRTITQKHH